MTKHILSLTAVVLAVGAPLSGPIALPEDSATKTRVVENPAGDSLPWYPIFSHRLQVEYERREGTSPIMDPSYSYRAPLYAGSMMLPLPLNMDLDLTVWMKERPEHFVASRRRSNVARKLTDYEYRFYRYLRLRGHWGRHEIIAGRDGFSLGPRGDLFPEYSAERRPNRALSISNHIQTYDQLRWSYRQHLWAVRFFYSRIEGATHLAWAPRVTRDLMAREFILKPGRSMIISLYETALINDRGMDLADLNPLFLIHNLDRWQTNTITGITTDVQRSGWRFWSELAFDDVFASPVEPTSASPTTLGWRMGLRVGDPRGMFAGMMEVVHTDPWFGNRESEGLRYRRLTDNKYKLDEWQPIGYWRGPDSRDLEMILQWVPAKRCVWWVEASLRQSGEITLDTPYLETGRPKGGAPTGVIKREQRLALSTRLHVVPYVAVYGMLSKQRVRNADHWPGVQEDGMSVRLGMELDSTYRVHDRGRKDKV